ncbi:MAG: DUF2779 domain-containing protein [Bacteroidia bacterium]|nr:DUF2779 domain-containing protein [Bacteroidia bacterium]
MTKLYYTGKSEEYADQDLNDPFLKALAEGGFQVGELAKYMFCEDPVAQQITVDTLNYDDALQRTEAMLARPGRVVIAEAAFKHNNLFIRADIVVKEGSLLKLYEVKAKSFEGEGESEFESEGDEKKEAKFMSKKKGTDQEKVKPDWVPYLYDLAFQKYVITKAKPLLEVEAYLLMVNKNATASVEGLNQKFKITRDGAKTKVITPDGITPAELGSPILEAVPMDDIVEKIWNKYPVPTDYKVGMGFEDFVKLCEETYIANERVFTPLGKKCRDCQYSTKPEEAGFKKSGFMECWIENTKRTEEELSSPLVLEIWGGGSGSRSFAQELIDKQKYFLREVILEDIASQNETADKPGLTKSQRRMEQVNRVKEGITESYFDKEGFTEEMSRWKWPLHMIDFETSMVALPFYKDTHPYQGVAFQFSHHILHIDGKVEHHNQFLHLGQGVYPNIDFVRALRKSLEPHEGSIFRYHNHENTYLRMIHRQLSKGLGNISAQEREELIGFVDRITRRRPSKKEAYIHGERAMIDLYDIVLRYYYSPFAKGSNSLKQILPAVIRDSAFLRDKYGQIGKYGRNKEHKSLNYEDQVWIREDKGNDPYKTLEPVFKDFDRDRLDALVKDFEGVADGGAALTAYNYLQFTEVPEDQRKAIGDALLRYCELDTLAMVMLVEGWREWGR